MKKKRKRITIRSVEKREREEFHIYIEIKYILEKMYKKGVV